MMQFTEDMKIGVPNVDSQHQSLIDFANSAAVLSKSNPTREEMKECLDFLGNYVIQHFFDEEQLQLESKYTRYRQHKAIHTEFVETFKSLYAEFVTNGPSDALSFALNNSVSDWIITHIKKEDVVFGAHYSKYKLDKLKKHIGE